jgi:membrane protease YdiL (CAAX protease family)
MFHSLPNREPDAVAQPRNPWAVVDLLVFGIFAFIAFVGLAFAYTRLTPIYAIPLQGLFDCVLVVFIAFWIRTVRHSSFTEYVHFFRNRMLSMRSLVILGPTLAISGLLVSTLLPSGPTPLEKFLTSRNAIVLFAVFGVAVAPLMEEIIFRGFLFKALWEIGGSRLAVPGSAVLFAAPHFPQLAGNWGAVVLIFIVGFILSVIRHRSNSIIPTFIVHTSYNATLFVLFLVGTILQKVAK